MNEFMVAVFSYDNCPACQSLVGNKLIDNGKPYMSYDFIKKLLDIENTKIKIIIINFPNVQSGKTHDRTPSILSSIYLDSDKEVVQEYFDYDKTRVRHRVFKQGQRTKTSYCKPKMSEIFKKIAPEKLLDYIRFFPEFIIFEKHAWHNCRTDPERELLGLPQIGYIIRTSEGKLTRHLGTLNIPGEHYAEGDKNYTRKRNDIYALLQDVVSGKEKIKVHSDEIKTETPENFGFKISQGKYFY